MSKINVDVKIVGIEDVFPNPWNPNIQSVRVEEATTESIGTFGMLDPLTVRPHPVEEGKYEIIDGAHRQASCMKLGYKEIPVNIIRGLTEGEAKKLTIIANETRGYAEKTALADLLSQIKPEFGDDLIHGLPYYPEELENLIQMAEHEWEDFNSNFDGTADGEDSLEEFNITHPQEGAESFDTALNVFLEKYPDAELKRN